MLYRSPGRQINRLAEYIGKITLSENDIARAKSILRYQKVIDPKLLIDTAFTHHVLPQIYTHLRLLEKDDLQVKQSVAQFLDLTHDEIARRKKHMARLRSELEQFARGAEEQGVRYLAIKGLCLQDLYPSDAFRDMWDVDLLLAPESGWLGIELVKCQGYSVKRVRLESYPYSTNPQPNTRSGVFGVAEMLSEEDPEPALLGDTKPMSFDLHLGAFPGCGDSILESELWQRFRSISGENGCVHLPSFEDAILIICVHIGRHGFAKLKDLNDTAAILNNCQNRLDWNYLCTFAAKNNLDLILYSLLERLKIKYGVSLPEGIPSKLMPRGLRNLFSHMLFSTGKRNPKFHGGRQLFLGRFMQAISLLHYYQHRSSLTTALKEARFGLFFLFHSGRPYKLWKQRIVHSFEANRRIVIIPIQPGSQGRIWRIREIHLAHTNELGRQMGVRTRWLNNQTLAWNEGQEEEIVLTPYGVYTQSAYDGHVDKMTLEKIQKVAWKVISQLVEAKAVSAQQVESLC